MSVHIAMIASGRIDELRVGKPEPLAGKPYPTAYRKQPVTGPVPVGPLGLVTDTQVNRKYHGGPEKAVYAYPVSGYAAWAVEFPDIADRFGPGAMGENLVVSGLDESSVHLGDVIRAGTALLQVSQIREPCATFAAIIGTAKVVRAMTRSGRCGWYLRVLEPGVIAPGDAHDVIERPNPGWPIRRFTPIGAGKAGTLAELDELARLPGLTPEWQVRLAEQAARQRAGP